ncbi:MAG TPA: glycosyltransferase family 39 protein [Thermoanaerobaculia bacterium]|nr:glycosyltransferase family 39 protein [Thermoanaerobaculia bacterium]
MREATREPAISAPPAAGASGSARRQDWIPIACGATALLVAVVAVIAAHRHRPPPQSEWGAVALWAASIGLTLVACRTPRAERAPRLDRGRADLASLAALLVLGASLLLPWLEIYPLEIASDPPRDSGVLTQAIARSDARIFQYGFFNGFSFVMSATNAPFYLLLGPSSLAFKGLAAALGIVTPMLLYLLARRYLPLSHALAAAALMLSVPAYMFYARREPVHAYNPFWMVVLLAAVMRVEEQDAKPRTFGVLGLVAGVTVHFHAAVKAAGFAALGVCALLAIARTVTGKQTWRRLLGGGVAAVLGFLIGIGPLLLVSDLGLLFSSGRLSAGARLEPLFVLDAYQRSLRVFFDEPTRSWFPTHQPLIPSATLSALFAIGAVFGFVAVPLRLQLTLVFFVLVLPLTNSALTDILNGEHRLSPLFPAVGLLMAMGLAVLHRATAGLRPPPLRRALRAALLLVAGLAAAQQVHAFFVDEQARHRDRFAAYLVHEALREIERTPRLDRARTLCIGGGPPLHRELQLGHYRDGFSFYRPGQTIRAVEVEGAPDNDIFVSASCKPFDGGADWSTRTFCSPRLRFVCPGAEVPFRELRIHVDRRPELPQDQGGAVADSAEAAAASTLDLANTKAVRAGPRSLRRSTRLDVAALRARSAVNIEVNDQTFLPHLDSQFDGDTLWPSRSDGVNPLVLTLTFTDSIRLSAVRVFPTASTYQWAVEARAGERWSRPSVRAAEWSQIDLREPVETTTVRIELLRLERDDNVHLSEIELYAAP